MSDDSIERRRRQVPLEALPTPAHPVFEPYRPWIGEVDAGWDVNFLGVRTRVAYFSLYEQLGDFSRRRKVEAGLPLPNEDYFEWIALLEAVQKADGAFVMVELGAGWGRWIVNAAAAVREHKALPYHLVGVEAEPTHFRWMKEHVANNDIDPQRVTLIEAAVTRQDGEAWFHVGRPADWYGQGITVSAVGDRSWRRRIALRRLRRLWGERRGGVERVRAVSLSYVLDGLTHVDLLDIDIQGAESDALEPAADPLDAKVKRAYVATHDCDNEERVRAVFQTLGWANVYDYPASSVSQTPWGRILFEDGVQVWVNPRTIAL